MNAKKLETYSLTSLIFSSFLHVVILFTVLTALFLLLIVKLATEIFNHEIESNLESFLIPALENVDQNQVIKDILKNAPLERLERFYSEPSADIEVYNKWLRTSMFLIIGFFVTILLILTLFLYFTCGKMIPLWHIIEENIVIFSVVGSFEAVFFLMIARKYIPCPPSFMMETFFDDIKNI